MSAAATSQRADALKRATQVRSERASFKRELAAGTADAVALLSSPPWWAETWTVGELLAALPWVGAVRVRDICRRRRVSMLTRLADLTSAQRAALAVEVARRSR